MPSRHNGFTQFPRGYIFIGGSAIGLTYGRTHSALPAFLIVFQFLEVKKTAFGFDSFIEIPSVDIKTLMDELVIPRKVLVRLEQIAREGGIAKSSLNSFVMGA